MRIEENREQCTACAACEAICPKKCIYMTFDKEGFYYPIVDHTRCVSCGKCEKICHCFNKLESKDNNVRHSFYGISQSKVVLQGSSSGGVFHHLAESVIDEGGIVFGAVFDNKEQLLVHTSTDKVPLEYLQKSKYIESRMSGVIPEVISALKSGRKVLFCGTPCQISGIKRAILQFKDNLLTCDFVCHGVPSSMLFRNHLQNLLKRNEQIEYVDFRPKDISWVKKYIRIQTSHRVIERPYYLDSFYYGFMECNAFLRRSCYNCCYRSHHESDVTIADFWRWQNCNPKLDPKNGISLIVANSERGLNQIQKMRKIEIVEIKNKYSDYIYMEKAYPKGEAVRDDFYRNYDKYGFEMAAKKTYMYGTAKRKIKYEIKKVLGKEK